MNIRIFLVSVSLETNISAGPIADIKWKVIDFFGQQVQAQFKNYSFELFSGW